MKSYELIYDSICFLNVFTNQENSCIDETLLKELYKCVRTHNNNQKTPQLGGVLNIINLLFYQK